MNQLLSYYCENQFLIYRNTKITIKKKLEIETRLAGSFQDALSVTRKT